MTNDARPRLPIVVRRAIVRHAVNERPLECCGFLVGIGRRVMFAFPMKNVDASPVRYRIDDRAHIELRRTLRGFDPGLSIVGVYHSHPGGLSAPSPTDIAEAHYPDWIHVIVGLGRSRAEIGMFRIRNGRVRRLGVLKS